MDTQTSDIDSNLQEAEPITLNEASKETSKLRKRLQVSTKHNIFTKSIITRKIVLSIMYIGGDIKRILENEISRNIENKCIVEGYIKPNTTKVLTHSCGVVHGENVAFDVEFECEACLPVEGMIIPCVAKDITKAGIRAVANYDPTPVIVFIARDHHHMSSEFSNVKTGDQIVAKVIGQRFELNDPVVSVIAELQK